MKLIKDIDLYIFPKTERVSNYLHIIGIFIRVNTNMNIIQMKNEYDIFACCSLKEIYAILHSI